VFRNLVNRHDVTRLTRKLRRLEAGRVLAKLRIRGQARVVAHWADIDPSMQEWWAIPAVQRRWNTFASGDPAVTFPMHVARTHLAERSGLRALSLGCGTGGNEINWARLGVFDQIVGVDISPERIEAANAEAKRQGLAGNLVFRVADAHELIKANERYDVVLGLHSLHHFDRLDATMVHVAQLVDPDGGLLVVDEFVGPTRFQWTSAQLAAANRLLGQLPAERRRMADGRVKRRAIRPSRMAMILDDPSEAVDADRLVPAIRANFDVVEELPYGGTVLHVALSGIAQNFLGDDAQTAALLDLCFRAEDEALPELGHDFAFMVCRPKSAADAGVEASTGRAVNGKEPTFRPLVNPQPGR
jgi:2-polyprenyl-3-methyl-5-hydroxy-6-metoxy-1,4-benzoquinol methylase